MSAVETCTVREARLRPEFARNYPFMVVDQWAPAALVTDHMITWLCGNGKGAYLDSERVLPDEHFDFRGSTSRPNMSAADRSRQSDYDGWIPPASRSNPADAGPEKPVDFLRGMAHVLGADRTSVFETSRQERLVLRMYIGSRSTMIECTAMEVRHLSEDFIGAQVHERISDALQGLRGRPAM